MLIFLHLINYGLYLQIAMYTYKTKDGFGLHKDGKKLHGFTYECITNSRSKDLFGEKLDKAMGLGKEEDRYGNGLQVENSAIGNGTAAEEKNMEEVGPGQDTQFGGEVDIYALANVLRAAYVDLVINGNDDMTSYLYLTEKAIFALSEEVKSAIGEELAQDGGVALALVTELVATVTDEEKLFIKAVTDREDLELSGIEALNEENLKKVYSTVTPRKETHGLLAMNGVGVESTPWAQNLIQVAPTLDKLVGMDFASFQGFFPDANDIDGGSNVVEYKKARTTQLPGGDELIAHKMYAGLIGRPTNVEVPAIRGLLLENGVGLQVASQMEQVSLT